MMLPISRGFVCLACACALAGFVQTASSQSVVATIQLNNSPAAVAVDPALKKVYVAVGSGVQIIDETSNTVTGYISDPSNWGAIVVATDPFRSLLYVGAQNGGLFIFNEKTNAESPR